ncbi:MAG: methyltransferase domain-containing protein [Verrucomicrobia bacterium]|nr:methyltransferase domain-containing protein [Verrucomicrobiota bacterium]MBS0636813.1 methyltransferase domain-containing protein [Verrucomicrobiota bacterium]
MNNIFLKIEELTQNVSLKSHYAALSHRYRYESDKAVSSHEEHLAYIAARMPATFAVSCEVFRRLKEVAPSFSPKSMLDVGAGPGTCILGFLEEIGSLEKKFLVERDEQFIPLAKEFLGDFDWQQELPKEGAFDLVSSSYMLSELDNPEEMVQKMAALTTSTIVLIDTGTPFGYATLMKARDILIAQNFTVLAPCPHNHRCPAEWCHFSVRLPRSRIHRQMKGAELGYEDEKFCYLIASKTLGRECSYERIIAPPKKRSGHAYFTLCMPDGTLSETIISKKAKERYQKAKKAEWGDAL